jgi:hypothetical protein
MASLPQFFTNETLYAPKPYTRSPQNPTLRDKIPWLLDGLRQYEERISQHACTTEVSGRNTNNTDIRFSR